MAKSKSDKAENKAKEKEKQRYTVSGRVFNAYGEPIAGQKVLAADVDLRGAAIYRTAATVKELTDNKGFELLGKDETNADGFYQINFSDNDYKNYERRHADVIVFALNDDDQVTGRSKLSNETDYTGNAINNWDIRLSGAAKRRPSEYRRLMQVIAPFMKENKMELFQLSSSEDQVSFLASETNQVRNHVALIVQADKLQDDHTKFKLSHELLYGAGRQNIPLTWSSLILVKRATIVKAIRRSIGENIIDPQDSKTIDQFIENLLTVALLQAVKMPEASNLFRTMTFSLKNPAMQKIFAQSYLQFDGKPEDFWEALSKEEGFTPAIIRSLQLSNQLSILTNMHTALIEELQVNRKINDPSELLELETREWSGIIKKTGFPEETPGNTPEEKEVNYINNIQSTLVAAYPTKKIALLVAGNQILFKDPEVKERVTAFFTAAPEFDISRSRVSGFNQVLKEVAGKLYDPVVQNLQLMQRIYQVSPSPQVMTILLGKGYTSAYHISSMSQNAFINTEAENIGGATIAADVHNRARYQVMRAQQIMLKIRDTQDKASPVKIITADQQTQIMDAINKLN